MRPHGYAAGDISDSDAPARGARLVERQATATRELQSVHSESLATLTAQHDIEAKERLDAHAEQLRVVIAERRGSGNVTTYRSEAACARRVSASGARRRH